MADLGGGIRNEGSLVLRDVVVRGNTADRGAGVYNQGGKLTLNGSHRDGVILDRHQSEVAPQARK